MDPKELGLLCSAIAISIVLLGVVVGFLHMFGAI